MSGAGISGPQMQPQSTWQLTEMYKEFIFRMLEYQMYGDKRGSN